MLDGVCGAALQNAEMSRQAQEALQDARAAFYQCKYGEKFCGLDVISGRPIVMRQTGVPRINRFERYRN